MPLNLWSEIRSPICSACLRSRVMQREWSPGCCPYVMLVAIISGILERTVSSATSRDYSSGPTVLSVRCPVFLLLPGACTPTQCGCLRDHGQDRVQILIGIAARCLGPRKGRIWPFTGRSRGRPGLPFHEIKYFRAS